MRQVTTDAFFNGRLRVFQEKPGYRFTIDAVLLAGWLASASVETVVDLGCGCGIIGLVLRYKHPRISVFGVEIQPRLAALAKKNVEENDMTGGIQILTADIKTIRPGDLGKPVDVIVSNPPYRKIDSGRLNPDPEEAAARHEILAALPDVLAAARRLLAPAGRCALIYPAERTVDLLTRMRRFSIEPKRIRFVHFIETEAAKRILVEGVKGGRPGAVVEPPLVVYDRNGEVTADAARFLEE